MDVIVVSPPDRVVEKSVSRPFFSFHLALGAVLCMWAFFFIGKSVADPDLWWHLRNAQYLFTTHHIPSTDMYSFTLGGSPWIDHEWLSEIPYYLANRAFGLRGVFWLYILTVDLILLLIFYFSYRYSENVKAAWVATSFGVMLAVVNFGPRSILFGWVCLLILLAVLWRYQTSSRGPLWLLPPLFCLWINTHGSWLIGMIVFAMIIAGGAFSGMYWHMDVVPWSRSQLRNLVTTFVTSAAALFVNPYTYKLVFYPFDLGFKQKLNIEHVEEWASVNFHEPRGKVVLAFLFALLLSALLVRVRWTLQEVALTLFALYTSLTYVRFLFLAAILVIPILAKRLQFLPQYRPEIDKPVLNACIVAVLLVIMVSRLPSDATLQNDLAQKFPVGGIGYLRAHGRGARVFNHYTWGGFLIWNVPEVPTFVDSRTDIFDHAGVLKNYLDVIGMKKSLDVLDRYQIRYVLFSPKEALAYFLENNARWKVVYRDNVSIVFERTRN
jgi:hypothetical protein